MSRKKCKRKIYQLVNPIEHAIAGACVPDEKDLDRLRFSELMAYDAMQKGKADIEDWRTLVDMVNLCEMFIKRGVGKEALEDVNAAHHSLHAAVIRYRETGKMGLDGIGLKALKEVFAWHDLQRSSVSRSFYESIIEDVINHIRSNSKEVVKI